MEQLGGEFIQNFHRGERILTATRAQWVISLKKAYQPNKLLNDTIKLLSPGSLQGAYTKMKENMETVLSQKLQEEFSHLTEFATHPTYNLLVRNLGEPFSVYMATVEENGDCVDRFLQTFTSECNFCRKPDCAECLQLINLHVHMREKNLDMLAKAFVTFLVNITFCCCFDSQ